MWRGSTGVKRCGVALTSATTRAPVRNLSPSWVVSLSVATSFHTTAVGGTVPRYICASLCLQPSVHAGMQCTYAVNLTLVHKPVNVQHATKSLNYVHIKAVPI